LKKAEKKCILYSDFLGRVVAWNLFFQKKVLKMAVDEKLQTARHSLAHVMAEAILKLIPETKIAIGPAIDNGFYYDFEFPAERKLTEADFPAVEKEMRKILAGNFDFIKKEVIKAEAL